MRPLLLTLFLVQQLTAAEDFQPAYDPNAFSQGDIRQEALFSEDQGALREKVNAAQKRYPAKQEDYARIDSYVIELATKRRSETLLFYSNHLTATGATKSYKHLRELVKLITAKSKNKYEKVRALYRFFAEVWAYDHKRYMAFGWKERMKAQHFVEPWDRGLCSDYAKALGELLIVAGFLDSGVMGGAVNTTGQLPQKGKCTAPDADPAKQNYGGHSWNYVKLDGKKYFLDGTWAAKSYKDATGKIITPEDPFFLIPVEQTACTHFPESKASTEDSNF